MSGEESFLQQGRLALYRGIDANGNAALGPVERVENTYSNSVRNLRKFRAACGKIRYGVAGGTKYASTILFIGDSKTMGAGADGSAGNTAGAEPYSKPSSFATILTANGLPNTRNGTFGFRGLTTAAFLAAYDTRFVTTTDMAQSGVLPSLGGYYWRIGSTTVQQFTPTGNVDTVDIFTRQSLGQGDGTMGVKVDSGAELVSINCDGASNAIIKTTVALGSLGTHAIQFYRKSGGFCFVIGLRAYNAASGNGFEIINAGAYGSTSSFHTDPNTWSEVNVIPTLNNLSLVCIQLGTNDPDNSVAVTTTIANVQAIVTAAKSAGADVIIEFPTYGPDGQYGTSAQREQMRQGFISLAAANACMMVDHATRFISWADANALGMVGSSVHETAAGYADEAQFLSRIVLA